MRRQIFLLAAIVSVGAVAAQLDMQLFERQDLDKDGFVDRVEARDSVDLQARFKDIDVDRNGRLSASEMQDWIAKANKRDNMRDSAHIDPVEQRRAVQQLREARETSQEK